MKKVILILLLVFIWFSSNQAQNQEYDTLNANALYNLEKIAPIADNSEIKEWMDYPPKNLDKGLLIENKVFLFDKKTNFSSSSKGILTDINYMRKVDSIGNPIMLEWKNLEIKSTNNFNTLYLKNCSFINEISNNIRPKLIITDDSLNIILRECNFESIINISLTTHGEIITSNNLFEEPFGITGSFEWFSAYESNFNKRVDIKFVQPKNDYNFSTRIFMTKNEFKSGTRVDIGRQPGKAPVNQIQNEVSFNNCEFNKDVYSQGYNIEFLNSTFRQNSNIGRSLNISGKNITFENNKVHSEVSQKNYNIGIGKYPEGIDQLSIKKSKIHSISLDDIVINKALKIDSVQITNSIGLNNLMVPEQNTDVPFKYVNAGIISLETYDNKPLETPYNLRNIETFSDEAYYRDLLACYTKLLNIYKIRGDKVSYNQCFVEKKQLEIARQETLYAQNPTFSLYFKLMLNKFLKTFSAYGTAPEKAMIYSIYVILLFALVYFLFPSEMDNLSRKRLQTKLDKLIRYFTSDSTLSDVEIGEKRHMIEEIQTFKGNLQNSQKRVPWLITFLGKPLYSISMFYYSFTLWMLNKADISKGTWEQQDKKGKVRGNILVVFYFMIFLFWGILVRLLNSISLSMNAFVTLGFGEIQASGFARYVAIAEGLIGWFLLSIFSVSLISQVLQV